MATPGVQGWQNQILQGVGAPSTPQNMTALNAWAQAEGGSAANNPFNTTEPMQGASNYNSVGVRNYLTPQQGIKATIDTLNGPIGNYGPILAALKAGNNPMAVAQAIAGSQWGTGQGVVNVLGGQSGPTSASGATVPKSTVPTLSTGTGTPKLPSYNMPPAPSLPSTDQTILGSITSGQNLNDQTNAMINQQLFAPSPAATAAPHTQGVTPDGNHVQFQSKPTTKDVQAVQLAEHFIGTPYQWGGASPKTGFDCSGLIQYVWGKQGVDVPRTTYEQFQQGTPVAKKNLQPGDAVYFTGSDPQNGLPGHVGMYIGSGKFIEAPHTGADVRVSNLAGRSDYVGARTFV